jgi:hypothetical protein
MPQTLDFMPALQDKDPESHFRVTAARAMQFVQALPEGTRPLEALALWIEAEEARKGNVRA